jgi:hypothetical protein
MSNYESYPTIDASQLLLTKIQQSVASIPPEFDPYQALLKRKKQQDSGELPPIKDINADDLYELQQFCQTHGVVGFNFGRMNPKAALQMLKSRMGIRENPTPTPAQKTVLLG